MPIKVINPEKIDDNKFQEWIDYQFSTMAGDTYRNRYWKNPPGGHNKNKFRKLPKKCAICGATEDLMIHGKHGPAKNRKNLKSRKGLMVLCRSCHVKLHNRLKNKSKGHKEAKAILENYEMVVFDDVKDNDNITLVAQASIVKPDDEMIAKASDFGLTKSRDDNLFTIFKLCHVGTNNNKDHFLYDELKEHHATARMQPIDWEHESPNIGLIYDTQFIENDPNDSNPYVLCAGVVWKHKYPDKAMQMERRYREGKLWYSMSTHFDSAECSVCHGVYAGNPRQYCSHLKFRFTPISEAARILNNIRFLGGGVVTVPADIDAINVALM